MPLTQHASYPGYVFYTLFLGGAKVHGNHGQLKTIRQTNEDGFRHCGILFMAKVDACSGHHSNEDKNLH